MQISGDNLGWSFERFPWRDSWALQTISHIAPDPIDVSWNSSWNVNPEGEHVCCTTIGGSSGITVGALNVLRLTSFEK